MSVEIKSYSDLETLWHKGRVEELASLLESSERIRNLEGFGEPAFQSILWLASSRGQLDLMRVCIKIGADVNYRDGGGDTPLLAAAGEGQGGAVKFLIENGANPNDERYLAPWPIHAAARSGDPQTVRALLMHGADPNQEDLDGNHPLDVAATWGRPLAVAELLTAGADPNQVDELDHPPLWHAIRSGCMSSVEQLVSAGASIDDTHTFGFFTIDLSRAARMGLSAIERSSKAYQEVGKITGLELAELMIRKPGARGVIHWDLCLEGEVWSGVYDDGIDRTPLRGGEYEVVFSYLKSIVS